ncbi:MULTISPECIES: hypothetical protein [Nguyenibacter]|uniref:hypothetical protein n=1 Tax=Nguyenibacter TaxID=1519186 RepID=UPI001C40088C|nr:MULTISPECIES: hypothetical protein [Nguyenibacter]WRH88629.1 hypothetical protein QN315_03095 [Nguyenibacter sp. L1]
MNDDLSIKGASSSTRPPRASGAGRRARSLHKNHGPILALLDKLTGDDGEATLGRLMQQPECIDSLAAEIASGASIERIRKRALTLDTMISELVEADFAYVGLPKEARDCDFRTGFETYLRPVLGKRAQGFAAIFERLDRHTRPFIVETGSLRIPDNWEGDGQSTFQFDWYARTRHGSVFTIDINPASIDSARRACSGTTSTILNDSVAALHALGSVAGRPAALIYLDSFDLDLENPVPSAVHHAMEVMAARRLIGEGTIICVDDFDVPPLGQGGKGLIVDQFMSSIGAEVVYSGYQKVWQLSG